MSLGERHHDVAAYALGVLEPADALRCEEHLARCPACAVGLADFAFTASALAQLAEREPLRPLGSVRGHAAPAGRRRARGRRPAGRRWRARVVGVAAALAVAVPGAVLLGAPDGVGEDPGIRRAAATDSATGASASVALRDREWGTEVALRVAGVRGPHVCELVVVGTDGRAWPVMTWATDDGDKPLMEGGIALRLGEIERLEVRSVSGERLVSVRP
ncbi:anti-sigma factor family protein [Streptomyces ficellus]|uniref:Zf-HC2 domain-containing protein n=1 Tax=Streptomyces ficellus TaxID=1977088 RepID=A0A6I6F3X6_9ACTN|nr:zf-HC2 domain-containing protein [Streptomyces ficellus]QGV77414.1 zf-HC2 domain-containing protein [Streptomyces ficellus]